MNVGCVDRRFYWALECSVTQNITGRLLWPIDLPQLSAEVQAEIATLTSPSGVNYTLIVDVREELLRFRTAIVVYLNRVVLRSHIADVLDALNATLTAMNPGTLPESIFHSFLEISTRTANWIKIFSRAIIPPMRNARGACKSAAG